MSSKKREIRWFVINYHEDNKAPKVLGPYIRTRGDEQLERRELGTAIDEKKNEKISEDARNWLYKKKFDFLDDPHGGAPCITFFDSDDKTGATVHLSVQFRTEINPIIEDIIKNMKGAEVHKIYTVRVIDVQHIKVLLPPRDAPISTDPALREFMAPDGMDLPIAQYPFETFRTNTGAMKIANNTLEDKVSQDYILYEKMNREWVGVVADGEKRTLQSMVTVTAIEVAREHRKKVTWNFEDE